MQVSSGPGSKCLAERRTAGASPATGVNLFRGLRVCFVAATLGQGGAEQQLFYIVKTLLAHGARPRLLCLTRGDFWTPRLQELGVPISWVGQGQSRLGRLIRILKVLRRERPQVVQSQHFHMNLYVALAGRLLRIPEIGALRSDTLAEVASVGGLAGRWSLRGPRTLAANSRAAIANAIKLGVPRHRLHFLPNVLDTAPFQPACRDRRGPVQLLMAGRLSHEKRVERFLGALARLRTVARQPFKAVIVGDGPQRAWLEQRAAELNLSPDQVGFRGYISDMRPLYQQSDLLVLTSEREGTPNVILEAMAFGLPVVATAVGGVPDLVIPGKTGVLVAPDDEFGLSAALAGLVEDPAARHRMGGDARRLVESQYSFDSLQKPLIHLYQTVLA